MKKLVKLTFGIVIISNATNIIASDNNAFASSADGIISINGINNTLNINELTEGVEFSGNDVIKGYLETIKNKTSLTREQVIENMIKAPQDFIKLCKQSDIDIVNFFININKSVLNTIMRYISISWLVESFVRNLNPNDEYIEWLKGKYVTDDVTQYLFPEQIEFYVKITIESLRKNNINISNTSNLFTMIDEFFTKYFNKELLQKNPNSAIKSYTTLLKELDDTIWIVGQQIQNDLLIINKMDQSNKDKLKEYLLNNDIIKLKELLPGIEFYKTHHQLRDSSINYLNNLNSSDNTAEYFTAYQNISKSCGEYIDSIAQILDELCIKKLHKQTFKKK